MKAGTAAIIGHLKRSKSTRFTRAQWGELLEDLSLLGREAFLDLAVATDTKPRSAATPKSTKVADPLLDQMNRYRKKSGLSAADFVAALHGKLAVRIPAPASKAVFNSAPKYLAHARLSLDAADIERGFAAVLAEHA